MQDAGRHRPTGRPAFYALPTINVAPAAIELPTIPHSISPTNYTASTPQAHARDQPPPVNPGAATRYNTPTQFQATTSSSFVVSNEPRLVNRIARNPRQQHSATPPSPSTARSFSMSALRNHARIVPPRTCIHDWTHIPMYVQW